MKLGFVTCVQLGLSCMEAIYQVGGRLDLAITLRDDYAVKKSGRVYLDNFCAQRDIPLIKVRHINDDFAVDEIRQRGIDWLFIIGWSQIAGSKVLTAPLQGAAGIHPTLLPEGRGRAAIPWAILKQLRKTGVTMFKLAEGVDTGAIIAQKEIVLPPDVDATWLYERVNALHMDLIREVMPILTSGKFRLLSQDESKASYWEGRKPEDGRIDLNGSVHDAERLVRAVTKPYPGAFVERAGSKLIIWRARIASRPTSNVCLNFPDGTLECLEYSVAEVATIDRNTIQTEKSSSG